MRSIRIPSPVRGTGMKGRISLGNSIEVITEEVSPNGIGN